MNYDLPPREAPAFEPELRPTTPTRARKEDTVKRAPGDLPLITFDDDEYEEKRDGDDRGEVEQTDGMTRGATRDDAVARTEQSRGADLLDGLEQTGAGNGDTADSIAPLLGMEPTSIEVPSAGDIAAAEGLELDARRVGTAARD